MYAFCARISVPGWSVGAHVSEEGNEKENGVCGKIWRVSAFRLFRIGYTLRAIKQNGSEYIKWSLFNCSTGWRQMTTRRESAARQGSSITQSPANYGRTLQQISSSSFLLFFQRWVASLSKDVNNIVANGFVVTLPSHRPGFLEAVSPIFANSTKSALVFVFTRVE